MSHDHTTWTAVPVLVGEDTLVGKHTGRTNIRSACFEMAHTPFSRHMLSTSGVGGWRRPTVRSLCVRTLAGDAGAAASPAVPLAWRLLVRCRLAVVAVLRGGRARAAPSSASCNRHSHTLARRHLQLQHGTPVGPRPAA